MKKIISSIVLSFIFAIAFSQNADASENEKIDTQIEKLSQDYDFELVDLENVTPINSEPLVFDNLQEFESYLKNIEEENNISVIEEVTVSDLKDTSNEITPFASTNTSTYTTSWWSPMNGPVMGVLSKKNMEFKYTWKVVGRNAEIQRAHTISSWQTGYHDVKWTHRSGSYKISTTSTKNDTVSVTAKGIYTLGAVIGGQPIGFTWNGSWTRGLTIKYT